MLIQQINLIESELLLAIMMNNEATSIVIKKYCNLCSPLNANWRYFKTSHQKLKWIFNNAPISHLKQIFNC